MAGSAARYFFLFLIGLVAGVIGTVMAMRALDARKDHFPESLMYVQQWHLNQLHANVEQNKCGAIDTIPHLQALRTSANSLEQAFPDLSDDERFVKHASGLRAALDTSLATPPLNCPGLGAAAKDVGEACKACHQDFRN
ncbi:MAG: cytochrome c [Lysobacter sp.]|nr:cytochrome c [Lysobacter sp.]